MVVLLWVFAGVGALTAAIVLAFLAALGWEAFQNSKESRRARQWHLTGAAYMRQRLVNDSWWFSEDEPTMNLLRRLGDGDSVDRVREDWRRERAALEAEV